MCLLCRPLWECHWASPAPLAASGAAGWSLLAAARKIHFEDKYCNTNNANISQDACQHTQLISINQALVNTHINPLLNDLLDLCNCFLHFDGLVTLRYHKVQDARLQLNFNLNTVQVKLPQHKRGGVRPPQALVGHEPKTQSRHTIACRITPISILNVNHLIDG